MKRSRYLAVVGAVAPIRSGVWVDTRALRPARGRPLESGGVR